MLVDYTEDQNEKRRLQELASVQGMVFLLALIWS